MGVWTLIYATDSAGNPTAGNLGQFRNAVGRGADVKVIYSPSENIFWSRNCHSVHFSGTGGSSVISATFMEAADTTRTGTGIDFESPFALEYHIYNRTGIRSVFKFNYQDHTPISQVNNLMAPMRWYVKDYRLTLWESIASLFADISVLDR